MCEFTELAELHNCKTTLNFEHSFYFDTYEKLSVIFNVNILGKQTVILQIYDHYTGDGLSIGIKNERMCEFTELAELHNCKTTLNFQHSFYFDTYEKLSMIFNVNIWGSIL